jgi:hypothetical protein
VAETPVAGDLWEPKFLSVEQLAEIEAAWPQIAPSYRVDRIAEGYAYDRSNLISLTGPELRKDFVDLGRSVRDLVRAMERPERLSLLMAAELRLRVDGMSQRVIAALSQFQDVIAHARRLVPARVETKPRVARAYLAESVASLVEEAGYEATSAPAGVAVQLLEMILVATGEEERDARSLMRNHLAKRTSKN